MPTSWIHNLQLLPVARLDLSGELVECNARWKALLGEAFCEGLLWTQAFVTPFALGTIEEGEPVERMCRLRRGLTRVLLQIQRHADQLVCIMVPQGAEADRLATLFEALPDLLFELDSDGRFIDYHTSSLDRLSYQPQDFMGEHYAKFFPPSLTAQLDQAIAAARAEGCVQQVEYELDTFSGRGHFEARMAATPSGGVLVLVRDFTQQRRQQEMLQRAVEEAREASFARSRFLANISHEIRTPMNGLMGVVQLLEQGELAPEQRRLVDSLRVSSRGMLRVIEDILDIAKLDAGKSELSPEVFNLPGLLEQIVGTYRPLVEQAGLQLCLEVVECSHDVVGDPQRLRQVLGNLIDNAVKYAATGTVTVRVSQDAVESWRFAVLDQGPGVPPGMRRAVFEPFQQLDGSTSRRSSGTGLGLSICRELVHRMGGRIWVEDPPDHKGAAFVFTARLPEASSTVDSLAGDVARADTTLRVLIVEDHPVNAMVVRTMLERDGHEVFHAGSGAAAVEFVTQRPVDVVLMDVHMPGTDGLWATRRIRQRGHSVPIIGLTADVGTETRAECHAVGMNEVLSKPVDWTQLRRVLAVLARHAPG